MIRFTKENTIEIHHYYRCLGLYHLTPISVPVESVICADVVSHQDVRKCGWKSSMRQYHLVQHSADASKNGFDYTVVAVVSPKFFCGFCGSYETGYQHLIDAINDELKHRDIIV